MQQIRELLARKFNLKFISQYGSKFYKIGIFRTTYKVMMRGNLKIPYNYLLCFKITYA